MLQRSRIAVDVLSALSDQTGQGHSQHSELRISSPLRVLCLLGIRGYSLSLGKVSQNCLLMV